MYYYINHEVFHPLKEFLEREGMPTQKIEKRWEIFFPKYFLFTKNKVDPNKPSIVHSPWIHDIPWKIKAPKIVIEEYFFTNGLRDKLFKKVMAPYKVFITLTPITHQFLIDWGKESFLLPPLLEGKLVKEKKDYILSVMRLERRKNPEMIVRLAKAFPEKRFIIATGGHYEKRYLEMLRLPNVQIIKERLPKKNLEELLAKARLFVFPTLQDPIGYAPIEALRFGTPVLLSTKAAVSSFFPDKEWVLPPEDENAWVEKVKEMWEKAKPEDFYRSFKAVFSKDESIYRDNYRIFKNYLKSFA
ncbi:MAG: glycosyltransferase family 4 protein [Candidatus Micrarchaeota archaeon]|nr:glycosyltransferase family 4 protein [Candidatus Micrarchaeota archaeon]